MPPAVFIAHPTPLKPKALELRHALATLGVSAFVDVADTPAGVDWADFILWNLCSARVAVFLLAADIHVSKHRYFGAEAEVAVTLRNDPARCNRFAIVPVGIPALPVPGSLGMTFHLIGLQGIAWAGKVEHVAREVAEVERAARPTTQDGVSTSAAAADAVAPSGPAARVQKLKAQLSHQLAQGRRCYESGLRAFEEGDFRRAEGDLYLATKYDPRNETYRDLYRQAAGPAQAASQRFRKEMEETLQAHEKVRDLLRHVSDRPG